MCSVSGTGKTTVHISSTHSYTGIPDAASVLGKKGDAHSVSLRAINPRIAIDNTSDKIISVRMSSFTMPKVWTDVNYNNSSVHFDIETEDVAGSTSDIFQPQYLLPHKNYDVVGNIAIAFKDVCGKAMLEAHKAAVSGSTATSWQEVGMQSSTDIAYYPLNPDSLAGLSGPSNNIISFALELNSTPLGTLVNLFPTPSGLAGSEGYVYGIPLNTHKWSVFNIFLRDSLGDSAKLLGGNRCDDTFDNPSIFTQVIPSSTGDEDCAVRFMCNYPAKRFTTTHLYVKSNLTLSRQYTTNNFNSASLPLNSDESHKVSENDSILAVVPVDTEVCTYAGTVFDDILISRNITDVNIYITDERNRFIGNTGIYNHNSHTPKTMSTLVRNQQGFSAQPEIPEEFSGNDQTTLGNVEFNAILEFDVRSCKSV